MRDLLSAFERAYPGITTDYHDLSARDVRDRFLDEEKAGRGNPDLLLSSSMDMQIKLVNDGYAQSYDSPEKGNLPDWRSEEHTSELQSLMRNSYAVFCLKKKKHKY